MLRERDKKSLKYLNRIGQVKKPLTFMNTLDMVKS